MWPLSLTATQSIKMVRRPTSLHMGNDRLIDWLSLGRKYSSLFPRKLEPNWIIDGDLALSLESLPVLMKISSPCPMGMWFAPDLLLVLWKSTDGTQRPYWLSEVCLADALPMAQSLLDQTSKNQCIRILKETPRFEMLLRTMMLLSRRTGSRSLIPR